MPNEAGAERIDRLERQVRYLLQYIGVDPEIAATDDAAIAAGPPMAAAFGAASRMGGPPPEIVALVQAGKLIQAIKAYRQMTGADLKESKNVIDSLQIELGLARRR